MPETEKKPFSPERIETLSDVETKKRYAENSDKLFKTIRQEEVDKKWYSICLLCGSRREEDIDSYWFKEQAKHILANEQCLAKSMINIEFLKNEAMWKPSPPVDSSFPKKTIEHEDGGTEMVEQYSYGEGGIRIEKICTGKTLKDGTKMEDYKMVEEVLRGELEINARVETQENTKKQNLWHITYCGDKYVGDFDAVVEFIFSYGKTKVSKERMKQALGAIISQIEIPLNKVYPSVGFFCEHGKNEIFCADNADTVFPMLETQDEYMRRFEMVMGRVTEEMKREVLMASVDFIDAMPERNKFPALIARAFCFIAPLGYVMKQTVIGVFPYLFLYGQKGSSKTHIGLTSSSYMFGEADPLTSDTMKSSFRLGAEFASTTLPRLVDDGDDIFKDNLATFKAAATGTIATKRGNKDRSIDTYRSFCPFIFTSNSVPIPPEEDARGALMDRLLVLECFSGSDFNREKYQTAFRTLSADGPAFGSMMMEELKKETKSGATDELIRIAKMFQDKNPFLTLRRAYCLAYVVWGIEKYYALLTKWEIQNPIPYEKEETIVEKVYSIFQENARMKELANLINFMDFVFGTNSLTPEEQTRAGIYPGARSEEDNYLIITKNTLNQFKRQYNLQRAPYSDLRELCSDLEKIGFSDCKTGTHRDASNSVHYGVKVGRNKYHELLENTCNTL